MSLKMILPQTHDGLPRKAQGEGMCWGDGQGCPLAVSPCVGTSYCLAGVTGPDPGPCGQYSGGSVHCFEWKWNWGRQAPEVTPGSVGQFYSLSMQGALPREPEGSPEPSIWGT